MIGNFTVLYLVNQIIDNGIRLRKQYWSFVAILICHLNAGQRGSISCCLAHYGVKVGRYGDYRILNLRAINFAGLPQHVLQDTCRNLRRSFVHNLISQAFGMRTSHLAFNRFCYQMRAQRILVFGKIAYQRLIAMFLTVIHAGRQQRLLLRVQARLACCAVVNIYSTRQVYYLADDIAISLKINCSQNRVGGSQVNAYA